jgi:hypothetical protein
MCEYSEYTLRTVRSGGELNEREGCALDYGCQKPTERDDPSSDWVYPTIPIAVITVTHLLAATPRAGVLFPTVVALHTPNSWSRGKLPPIHDHA